MKRVILSTGLVLGLVLSSPAALFTWNSGTLNTWIPDGTSSATFNGPASAAAWDPDLPTGYTINSLDVHLNISGTYNGDLYGYLVYSVGGNDHTTILLNRVGRTTTNPGYSTDGMNVILTGQGTPADIHLTESPTDGGTYLADARTVAPTADFTGVNRDTSAGLEYFNNSGLAANGTWLLFLSDVSGGDQSKLVSWGLSLEAVPEPVTWALIIFGGVAGIVWLARSKWVREQIARCRVAITAWLDAA